MFGSVWFFVSLFFVFKLRLRFLMRFQIWGRKFSSAITIYLSPVCLLSAEGHSGKDIFSTAQKYMGTLGTFAGTSTSVMSCCFRQDCMRPQPSLWSFRWSPFTLLVDRHPSWILRSEWQRSLLSAAHQLSFAGSSYWHRSVQTAGWRKFS